MTIGLKADAGGTFGTIQVAGADKVIVDSTGLDSGISISASVAANALTVTLNPCSLRLRSSTLGSGAVNSRISSSAISLVVPSGATLGTVNAIQSRLAILAIDNAGTLELAVVNLAGGNQLDETNLISTTAISAGSTSANTIYSTTARSSVPYRVVGYVESTQATAGTWATSPSTVQGYGGQALAAMQSIGFGQTWQNVSGSRALGTTYYNTTGRPITVSVSLSLGSGQGMTMVVNGVNVAVSSNGTFASTTVQTTIVPPGGSYSVTSAGTIDTWSELR